MQRSQRKAASKAHSPPTSPQQRPLTTSAKKSGVKRSKLSPKSAQFSTQAANSDALSHLSRKDLFQTGQFINGEFVPAKSGKFIDVVDPGNSQVIGQVAFSTAEDTREAISGAFTAQKAWAALPAHERATIVTKWGKLLMDNQQDLALLLSMEVGKPLVEARGEIAYAASFLDFYGKHGSELMRGETLQAPTAQNPTHIIVEKIPTGVAASPLPWNLPAAMATRKAGPALVAGCAMVLKPSELTPYSTLAIAVLANEAGIPPGVLQVVCGDAPAIGTEMTTNPHVRKLTFTGSTKTGALLMKQSADQIKNITMELGGNAPFIVFPDANIELAVNNAVSAKTRNAGQTCVTPNRFLVHQDVYDEFATKVAEKFEQLKVGYGLDEGVQIGPLINQSAVEKVQHQFDDAVSKGAKVLTGGKRLTIKSSKGSSDLFFAPTVLRDCTPDMDCFQNETFGPLLPLFKFKSTQEAIQLANDTPAGLAAYVFTQDTDTQSQAVRGLEFGMVACNQGSVSSALAPFGGMKTSGIGREGSRYGIEAYYEIKAIHYYSPPAKL